MSATPGRLLMWLFYSEVPVLLTTAMIGSEFTVFAAQIGLPKDKLHPDSRAIRVAKFGRATYHYFRHLPPAIVDKQVSSRHIDAVQRIVRYAHEPEQRSLILAPGYRDIGLIAEALGNMNVPLFAHHPDSNITRLRQDLIRSPGILLTVVWEGFNIVDPRAKRTATERRGLIDNVFITRLPFPEPHPMLQALLQHLYGSNADSWHWIASVQDVTRRTHQGLCRGIRGPVDWCSYYFCDGRIPPPEVVLDEWPLRIVPGCRDIVRAIPPRFVHDIRNFKVLDYQDLHG
jgi:Rad3-related DNA helicase